MDRIYELLEQKVLEFNQPAFIESDPIRIPHQFSNKEDIEVAGFLTAAIAWGQRISILRNAHSLMKRMDKPYAFIMHASSKEIASINFCHRTFNSSDLTGFIIALRNIYSNHGGLEAVFTEEFKHHGDLKQCLINFPNIFFEAEHKLRTEKHIARVEKNASAKRLNMFLRWMIRKDSMGVDFGLWKDIPASSLYIPLDVHSGSVARDLGILTRKQNDWKAVEELTKNLQLYDSSDPVKYDFALFGIGVNRMKAGYGK